MDAPFENRNHNLSIFFFFLSFLFFLFIYLRSSLFASKIFTVFLLILKGRNETIICFTEKGIGKYESQVFFVEASNHSLDGGWLVIRIRNRTKSADSLCFSPKLIMPSEFWFSTVGRKIILALEIIPVKKPVPNAVL